VNTRKIILLVLGILVLVGIGNFALNAFQTRSQLALIDSKDTGQQEAGVKALMDRGVLFDALQGGAKPEIRLAAIQTLKRMAEGGKNEAAFKQLLQMLKDPDTESAEKKTHPVRDAAKDAVAAVGTAYPEQLLDAAKNPDKNIQEQSRNALKQIGAPLKEQMAKRLDDGGLRAPLGDTLASIGPETIPLIAPFISPSGLEKFKDKPDDLRNAKIQLIEILGKFKVTEAALPILPLKDDEDPNVRRAVITSLANIGDPVGAPVLIAALNDTNTDATARTAAAVALGAIASPEANAAMLKALSDYDSDVASSAAEGLRRAGDKAATYIAQALTDPDANVRRLGVEAAGGMRTPALVVKAFADTDLAVREEAVLALSDILARANSIRAELGRLATATVLEEQEKAFRALQTRGAVLELLRPGSPAVARTNAIAMLNAKIASAKDDKERKPFEEVLTKLTDASVVASEAKASPLPNPADPTVLNPLLKALREKEGNIAANATLGLGRLGQSAVSALTPLLADPDQTVAYLASSALVTIARPAVDTLLTLAQEGKPAARWAAITLGDIGDNRAVPVLETLAQSSDPDTAYAASTALAKVKGV
jgi:HEAT repeat protein